MNHGVRVMIRESCISSGQCLSRSHLLEASQLDDRIFRQCIKFSRVSCKCWRRSGDALSCPDLRYESHDLNRDQWCHRDHGHDTEGIRHDITSHGDAGPLGQWQQKGRRQWPRRDAAGVEGDRRIQLLYEEGNAERDAIARDQQPHDGEAGQHAQHCEPQRAGHTDR